MDNQTEELWLTNISMQDAGTGLLALADPNVVKMAEYKYQVVDKINSLSYGTLIKVVISNITYRNCVQLGQDNRNGVAAYKWVPGVLASPDMVLQAAKLCARVPCVKRCAGYGCLCIDGECK